MVIRLATVSEISELSALALESKRSWGYDDEFIELCRGELTVDATDVEAAMVFVAEDEIDGVVGFYALGELPRPELTMLFVSPEAIGHGIGRALLQDALAVARSRGWASLLIESDPFAASFYEHVGAGLVGSSTSPSTGRTLPVYEIETRS
jgi:GNAT superfamily N-acetyltransferase